MSKDTALLKLKNVSKFYYNNGLVASGFNKISLEFNLGEFVVITGESGSGKSTLLNVLSGLDSYEEGEMYINGEETSHYGQADFENYRKTYIGNIFQSFNLISSYTVYQNIELVLLLNGFNKSEVKEKVLKLIKDVDLYRYRNTKVSKLSGGQKQRVAIARALAKETPIIIADEPTGNLDSKSASSVLRILKEVAKEKLVIIVTHNYDQVEKYATRKIEMHDGKVREDLLLKEYKKGTPEIYEYHNLSLISKTRLGIRNTFNILPKFLLMFIVFLFITIAFLGEYSSFKKAENEESMYGYNTYFPVADNKRIIINRIDHQILSQDEINNFKNIENVSRVEVNDTLIDTDYQLSNDEYYFWGTVENTKNITNVDEGRLPQNDNEIVISGYKYDYYLTNNIDELFETNLYLKSNLTGNSIYDLPFKIVGIIYDDISLGGNSKFYLSDNIIENIKYSSNTNYTRVNYKIINNSKELSDYKTTLDPYNTSTYILPNKNIAIGEVYIPKSNEYMCENNSCINKVLELNVENIYYKDSINLKITKEYTEKTIESLTGIKYDEYSLPIFISNEDYNSLYNKGPYQISIFTDNNKNVDKVLNLIDSNAYNTLALKYALSDDISEVMAVINIVKLIVTIVLFIALFFIAYFVIKLIQKSKNIYYSTVRILGGSIKDISSLIKIELYTIFNLTYILFMIFIILVKTNILNINYINNLTLFLEVKDYIFIYIIMFIMSFLIANRYSRKLFKSSAMNSYREEV